MMMEDTTVLLPGPIVQKIVQLKERLGELNAISFASQDLILVIDFSLDMAMDVYSRLSVQQSATQYLLRQRSSIKREPIYSSSWPLFKRDSPSAPAPAPLAKIHSLPNADTSSSALHHLLVSQQNVFQQDFSSAQDTSVTFQNRDSSAFQPTVTAENSSGALLVDGSDEEGPYPPQGLSASQRAISTYDEERELLHRGEDTSTPALASRRYTNLDFVPFKRPVGRPRKGPVVPGDEARLLFAKSVAEKKRKQRKAVKKRMSLGLDRYPCIWCEAIFTEGAELHRHIMTHPLRVDPPYDCTVCGLKYEKKTSLLGHYFANYRKRIGVHWTWLCDRVRAKGWDPPPSATTMADIVRQIEVESNYMSHSSLNTDLAHSGLTTDLSHSSLTADISPVKTSDHLLIRGKEEQQNGVEAVPSNLPSFEANFLTAEAANVNFNLSMGAAL